MAGFTTFMSNQILNNLLRTTPSTPAGWTNVARPGGVYMALFTVAPTDAGGGTEVTGGSYARVQVTQVDGSWNAPTGVPALVDNVSPIQFPQATADWGTVVAVGLMDAASAGNMLMWSLLTSARSVPNGATPSYAAGALDVTLD